MQAKENPEVEILRLLGPDGVDAYVSGQMLSQTLGISRTAVWKHIKALRKMGFSIEASTAKGYRLKKTAKEIFNGVKVQAGLDTAFVGKRIFFYEKTDSTNVKAFELARAGEPQGAAVIAEGQTGGKGRIGRRWESPAGVNLYTSVILRPPIPPRYAHNLTFLFAVAVAEAVEAFSPRRPTVKWPNDVLIDSRKVAGILMEMDSEADRIHFVVAGIGVNINMKASMLPQALRHSATSIYEKSGVKTDRAAFARVLYSSIEKWYKIYLDKGFGYIMESWKGYFDSEGRKVTVNCFDRVVEGICVGLNEDGALLVKTPSGIERIISGDIASRNGG